MDEIRHDSGAAILTSVGEQLGAARAAQGISIAEVADRTRIPLRHLAAIEKDEHDGLPAATYSAGFVKTYARLLGLDGQALSQQFRGELAANAPRSQFQEVYEPADPARAPSRTVAWASLFLALIAVLGILYWRGTRTEDPVRVAAAASDVDVPAQPRSAPTPTPVQPAAAPAAAATAVLTATSPVWLRITEPGRGKLFEGMLDTGKSFVLPADAADPRLLTGRPNALKVTVGDSVIPPLGPPEQRVRDVSLRPAELVARMTPAPAAAPAGASSATN